MKHLLSGNEAIARGAYEAGVTVAAGYPGTPSTEILENVVQYKSDVYCEWAPNEKVAFEMAAGAACAGARCLVTMKHVGLNVAADPLMTLAYIGVEGGFVVVVADDPGMHSSQNEQDTRNYAHFARIPVFEPADSQEAKDFVRLAIEVSETFKTPVILRSTTRISHSRSLVEFGERQTRDKAVGFEKDVARFVPVPMHSRQMRKQVEQRYHELQAAAATHPANRMEMRDTQLGIVTSCIAYQYVREVWPEASVLKLGWAYPFPDELLKKFADSVDQLLVVEELDPIIEEHLKVMGIACQGREVVPGIDELSVNTLQQVKAQMEQQTFTIEALDNPFKSELPARPPVLCPGCPHRGIFHALGKHDVVVTGDIGCYSLGMAKPLNRLDIILCMGGGVTMAHGMDKAGEPRQVVGIVGDSTFFHSGITGLLDVAYNKGRSTQIVVDNRTTAMTGHQENPGTGRTLMNEETIEASIQEIGKACGIRRVVTVNPYDVPATEKALAEELAADEASLIVSEAACPLREKKRVGPVRTVLTDACKNCKKCLKLGCPAIDGSGDGPEIIEFLCNGCGICQQVCPFHAIEEVQETL